MDWLSPILSGPIGAIIGAGGAIAQKILDYKDHAAQRTHELALRDKDMAHAKLEFEHASQLQKIEADQAVTMREFDAQASAIAADRATYGESLTGRIVDMVRGLIRPVVTIFAMAVVIHAMVTALRVPMLPADAQHVIAEVLFLCGNVIGYWFGTRSSLGRVRR